MMREAFARPPTESEREAVLGFIAAQTALHGGDGAAGPAQQAAWADFAHALFTTQEFIFVP